MDKSIELCGLIKNINIHDDSIIVTHHIKSFSKIFISNIVSGALVQEIFKIFNENALADPKFAANLAVIMSSRQLDSSEIDGNRIREMMINLLQTNFLNSQNLKNTNKQHFYNSITLLGEYFNKVKISNMPIIVLGKALLELLKDELDAEIAKCVADPKYKFELDLANLILNQITLNGQLVRSTLKPQMNDLLLAIRKCLINVPNLSSKIKAYFMMSLDLYYSNFTTLGNDLETLYTGFLGAPEEKNEEEEDANCQKEKKHKNGVKVVTASKTEEVSTSDTVSNESEEAVPLETNPVPIINDDGEKADSKLDECDQKIVNSVDEQTAEEEDSPAQIPNKTVQTNSDNANVPEPAAASDEVVVETDVETITSRIEESESINVTDNSNSNEHGNSNSTETCDDLNTNNSQPIKDIDTRDKKSIAESSDTKPSTSNNTELLINQNGNSKRNIKNGQSKAKTPVSMPLTNCDTRQSKKSAEASASAAQKNGGAHKVYFREENAENLTWDPLRLEEEFEVPTQADSNPYSSQFLNFLGNN